LHEDLDQNELDHDEAEPEAREVEERHGASGPGSAPRLGVVERRQYEDENEEKPNKGRYKQVSDIERDHTLAELAVQQRSSGAVEKGRPVGRHGAPVLAEEVEVGSVIGRRVHAIGRARGKRDRKFSRVDRGGQEALLWADGVFDEARAIRLRDAGAREETLECGDIVRGPRRHPDQQGREIVLFVRDLEDDRVALEIAAAELPPGSSSR